MQGHDCVDLVWYNIFTVLGVTCSEVCPRCSEASFRPRVYKDQVRLNYLNFCVFQTVNA